MPDKRVLKNRVCNIEYCLSDPVEGEKWQAEEILYHRVFAKQIKRKIEIGYAVGPIAEPPDTDVRKFVSQLLAARDPHLRGGDTELADFVFTAPPEGRPTSLDFSVLKDCYVVFELDPEMENWQFLRDDGVSLKSDCGNVYFDLRQITDTGGNSCIVYFSARVRDKTYSGNRDRINLRIEFAEAGNRILQVVLDPDIQNPGTPPDLRGASNPGRLLQIGRNAATLAAIPPRDVKSLPRPEKGGK